MGNECNERVFVCKYDPKEYKMDEIEKQSQIRLNSVNIDDWMMISKWDKDTNKGGIIQIHCKQTLIIGKNGEINVTECGYSYGFGIGKATIKWCGGAYGTKGNGFGQTYGNEELSELHFGSPGYNDSTNNRGGGIIELIADKIINYGKIEANGKSYGSGGSIKIQCKTLINKGKIEAKGNNNGSDGRIAIFCEDCCDESEEGINPKPFIKKRKYEQATQFTPI